MDADQGTSAAAPSAPAELPRPPRVPGARAGTEAPRREHLQVARSPLARSAAPPLAISSQAARLDPGDPALRILSWLEQLALTLGISAAVLQRLLQQLGI